jgi:hypothetical protein
MKAEAFARQAGLPVGFHRESGEMVSLAGAAGDASQLADPQSLTLAQQIALVEARWRAGEWDDLVFGTEGLIDLDRGIRELEAQSDIGRRLLAISLDAIAMVREHTATRNPG